MRWGALGSMRCGEAANGIVAIARRRDRLRRIEGIQSGAMTVGHRFHHPGPITIGGAHDYVEKLRACHVIVDHEERERSAPPGRSRRRSEAGLTLLDDEGLVVENAGLTEWPQPLFGRYDPDFLDVPREVIVLTMRTNQKYFACVDQEANLAPAFVCVANLDATDGGAAIVEGNHRVLAARLSDARFFWEQDLKVPLEEQAKKLNGIVFHEKLGTLAAKVERIAKIASWFVDSARSTPRLRMWNERRASPKRISSQGWLASFPSFRVLSAAILAGHRASRTTSRMPFEISTHAISAGFGCDCTCRQARHDLRVLQRRPEADWIEGSLCIAPRGHRVDRNHRRE